jgi:hypothetical protein
MVTEIANDQEFDKCINDNKNVCAVFMEKDSENEANLLELSKSLKQVKFIQVSLSKAPSQVKKYDIADHELPTFVFIQTEIEQDKIATGMSYRQLNCGGVTTANLSNQCKIVFKM